MNSQSMSPRADPVHEPIDRLLPGDPDPADKRAARRHVTSSEIGLMHVGRGEDFCRIRNISATGLMAHVYRPISVGDEVSVDLKSGLSLQGKVVWAADHVPDLASRTVRQIGLRFDAPIDVEPILASHFVTQSGALQRWPRLVVECYLKLILDDGRQLSGRLCDISQGGAKFQTPHSVAGQARGSLVLRGLPTLQGSVRWHDGTKVGIAFDVAIRLETLVRWIQDRRAEALGGAGAA
jgi:hypothetical protein